MSQKCWELQAKEVSGWVRQSRKKIGAAEVEVKSDQEPELERERGGGGLKRYTVWSEIPNITFVAADRIKIICLGKDQ